MTTVTCEVCGTTTIVNDEDVMVQPWPHIECPICGGMVPLF